MGGCSVAVIGGGPAGTLCAAHFAKRGAHVTVYEPKTLAQQKSVQLGWSIAMGRMGTDAIDAAGLSSDFGPTYRAEGISMVLADGSKKYFGKWAGETTHYDWWLTRATILGHLREQCVAKYGDLVTFMDGYSLVGGNLRAGEVLLENVLESSTTSDESPNELAGSGGSSEGLLRVQADIVVGADGAGSTARRLLQQQDKDLKVERTYNGTANLPYAFPKEDSPEAFTTLPTPTGKHITVQPDSMHEMPSGSFSMWFFPSKGGPAGVTAMAVSYQGGGAVQIGSLCCTNEWFEEQRTEEQLQNILEAAFPLTPQKWLHACAETTAANSNKARKSGTVQCSKLGSGRCVLIGDAAHCTSPALGTGAASALQDGRILAEVAAELLQTCDPTEASASRTFTAGLYSKTESASFPGAQEQAGKASSVLAEVAPVDTDRLACIADAWTRARMDDARALANLNGAFSTIGAFKKDPVNGVGPLLQALPVLVPILLSRMMDFGILKSFPEWLAIPQTQVVLFTGSSSPAEVEHQLRASFNKLLGVAAAASVAGVAIAGAVVRAAVITG